MGRSIGTDKISGGQPASIITVMTDRFGILVLAFPGVQKRALVIMSERIC